MKKAAASMHKIKSEHRHICTPAYLHIKKLHIK